MPVPIFAALTQSLLGIMLSLVAIFLILLVLVQRGRGGGLAGALGGMGGSSAFGAKAGDVFTRITIGAASVWILLCIAAAKWGASSGDTLLDLPNRGTANDSAAMAPAKMGNDAPADTKAAGKEGEAANTAEAPAADGASAPAAATAPAADEGSATSAPAGAAAPEAEGSTPPANPIPPAENPPAEK